MEEAEGLNFERIGQLEQFGPDSTVKAEPVSKISSNGCGGVPKFAVMVINPS